MRKDLQNMKEYTPTSYLYAMHVNYFLAPQFLNRIFRLIQPHNL